MDNSVHKKIIYANGHSTILNPGTTMYTVTYKSFRTTKYA